MTIDITLIGLPIMTALIGIMLGLMFTRQILRSPVIKTILQARKQKVALNMEFLKDEWDLSLAPDAVNDNLRSLPGATRLEYTYTNLFQPTPNFVQLATSLAKETGALALPKRRMTAIFSKKQAQIPMPTLEEVLNRAETIKASTNDPVILSKVDDTLKIAKDENVVKQDDIYVWKSFINIDEFEQNFPSAAIISKLMSYVKRAAAEKVKTSDFDMGKAMRWIVIGGVIVMFAVVGVFFLQGGKV